VVPYIEQIIKNGLAERVEGEHHPVQDPGPKGVKALRHMQALEKLIVEMGEEGVAWRDTLTSQAAVDFAGDETKAF
jgi:hypothetical protein